MIERSRVGSVQLAPNSSTRVGVIGEDSDQSADRGRVIRRVVWSERSDRPAGVADDAMHKYSTQ